MSGQNKRTVVLKYENMSMSNTYTYICQSQGASASPSSVDQYAKSPV